MAPMKGVLMRFSGVKRAVSALAVVLGLCALMAGPVSSVASHGPGGDVPTRSAQHGVRSR